MVTPLHVNGILYGCTQSSKLFALNADTGEEIWRFDPKAATNNVYPRCRGVSYYDDAANTTESSAQNASSLCMPRIIATTVDARIIAVDAMTGAPCTHFGDGGSVSLRVGMGEQNQELYFPTAAPTVVLNLVVVGGLVWDNQKVGEPSGVVRAFDAHTGALVWAWDLGNPAITRLPPEGGTYSAGTPNVWSTPAFDDALGLSICQPATRRPTFGAVTARRQTSVIRRPSWRWTLPPGARSGASKPYGTTSGITTCLRNRRSTMCRTGRVGRSLR